MNEKLRIRFVQILLLFIAVAALAAGIIRNEHAVVLQKAVFICLECIGIG